MASSSSRPELPEVTAPLFQKWVAEASAEFGSSVREEFGHGWELHQMSASSLQHQKPVGDSLAVLYSSEAIEQMERMCQGTSPGTAPSLQAQVNANPPLIIDRTYNNKHRRGGLRQEQESYRTPSEGPIAFQVQSSSSSDSVEHPGDELSGA